MLIRNATTFDVPAIAEIESICLGEDPWSEASLISHVSDPMCLTKLALLDGKIVGYISGRMIPNEAEIYRVATLPSHRRMGVGATLLSAFLGSAAAHGCDTFFLEVRASNSVAQGLYTSHGFVKTATRKNYYRSPQEDAVIYTLHLEEVVSC